MPRLRTAGAVLQSSLNLSDDHLDGDRVVSPARHYQVGVALARLDKLAMHRLNSGQVLFDDLVEGPPAIMCVALDASNKPDVRIRIDEHLDVAKVSHSLVHEQQNTVDDDYVCRLDTSRFFAAQVGYEIVLGLVDRLSLAERFEMSAEQVIVEGIGMIPIELAALVYSERCEILVVSVHVEERDGGSRKVLSDIPGDCGFPRARPASDTDYQRF